MSICYCVIHLLPLIIVYKQEKLPPTDSRLRPDQRFLENGEYEMANSEKLRLEQRQRQVIQISRLIRTMSTIVFLQSLSRGIFTV